MGDRRGFSPTVRRGGKLTPWAFVNTNWWSAESSATTQLAAFEGMRLERRDGTTILVGRIRDQAELQGVLTRISDLGLTLLSAKSLDE